MNSFSGPERRSGRDRRHRQASIFSKSRLAGLRHRPRRREDRRKAFSVDRHSPRTLVVILLIILLSISDAALTLYLIGHGAAEINPLMRYFLHYGPGVFFIVKYLLTSLSLFIILIYKDNFIFETRLRVKILFWAALVPFLLVVAWEVILFLLTI